MSYISVENVSLGYEGTKLCHILSFCVERGDYICIVGENGAGKSTLMKTLLQLMRPLSGSVGMGEELIPGEIGYLPQQTQVQRDFPASVWEIVLSGTLGWNGAKPFYNRNNKRIARENMEKMNVWNLRKQCYRKLSGGQQQRVLLARALCATKKLLLLDEPVTGLDPKVSKEFYETLRQLHEKNVTILMVTHDITAAVREASHILHMGKKQHFFGTTQAYLRSDAYQDFCIEEETPNDAISSKA